MASQTPSVPIPDFGDLYDPSTGRLWLNKAIHELVVGHLYAVWTDDQGISYLQWVYKDLHEITSDELEAVWVNSISNLPHVEFWESKSIDSPEVTQTLAAMKVEWNMWRDLGEEGIFKELGVE